MNEPSAVEPKMGPSETMARDYLKQEGKSDAEINAAIAWLRERDPLCFDGADLSRFALSHRKF